MSRVIALTGATGFIGSALVKRLGADGFVVRALYRQSRASLPIQGPNIHWVPGQLDDPGSLERLVEGSETIIHCAGAVRGSERRHFERVNTEGVARMVRAAMQTHPSPRFLLLSSLAAREPQLSYYAASKRKAEELLRADGHQLNWVALRPPAVYGPGDREITPLFKLMGKGVAPQASPRQARISMLYIDDLVAAIVTLLAQDDWHRFIFELHDGHPGGYRWDDVAHAVAGVTDRTVHTFRLPRAAIRSAAVVNMLAARVFGYAPMLSPGKVREIEHPDWTCDNATITTQIGWQPTTGLTDGIRKTFVFLGVIPDKRNRPTRGTRHADI
ncbi:MAG: NAD-dependent epimerase/dehydratase family protein [Desulfobacterales bacterium]|nr:NAD-dependent epimerase/dehydratase family protein [Desulfobacterales bacterium]